MQETISIIQILLTLTILYVVTKRPDTLGASTRRKGKKMVLDTSALIDGRIVEIANAGFTPSQLIIPKFIVHELQLLADGQDAHKRERARFGLDQVKELQTNAQCDVIVSKHDVQEKMPTDNKLVVIAKKLSADLCTTDYNLNKVASIEGVRVLNVNELANAIRPVVLPGEKKLIKIVQKGSNKDQGVGYLEDGAMIVVEGASRMVGKVVEVEVSRFIQTDAGKMLFAKTLKSEVKKQPSRNSTRKVSTNNQ